MNRQFRSGSRVWFSALGSACLLAAVAAAQAPENRPVGSAHPGDRRAAIAELAAFEAAAAQAAQVFLDPSRPEAERAAAVQGVDALAREDQIAAAVRLLRDPQQPPRLRALALHLVQNRIDRDDALVTDLLSWVRDPGAPRELRHEAITIFRALMFSSFAAHARRPEFLETLRGLTGDADPEIRELAFAVLAAHGDDLAQRQLTDCLKSPDRRPLPPARCAQLLGMNLHGDFLPVLDEVLRRPPDAATRLEALRLLGGYPPSRPEILRLLADPGEPDDVRATALAALNAGDPEHFPGYALALVSDEKAADSLRIYAIQAVGQRRGARGKRAPDDFDAAVARLSQGSSSAAVRRAAQAYLRATGATPRQGE